MQATNDFRKRMVIELIEALKEHPTFSNIQFALIKEAVLNSEQQMFLNAKNRQEYVIAINSKIEQIKKSTSMLTEENRMQFSGETNKQSQNMHKYQQTQNTNFYNFAPTQDMSKNRNDVYSKKQTNTKMGSQSTFMFDMNKKSNFSEKQFDTEKKAKSKKFSFLNEFENFFTGQTKAPEMNQSQNNTIKEVDGKNILSNEFNLDRKNKRNLPDPSIFITKKSKISINVEKKKKEADEINDFVCNDASFACTDTAQIVDIASENVPKNVNFTISINKKKEEKKQEKGEKPFVNEKVAEEMKQVVKEEKKLSDFELYIKNNNYVEVSDVDETEWIEALDFLLELGEQEEMYIMQHKNRHFKFLSLDQLNTRIDWYSNNIDNFIVNASKAYDAYYNIKSNE